MIEPAMKHWQQAFADFEVMLGRLHNQPAYNTGRTVLWQSGPCKLYHYASKPARHKIPLLIVFALVNTPAILDLTTDNSFIKSLIKKNFDVYLFDWGSAQENLSLDAYVALLDEALDYLVGRSKNPLNMMSICQGGVLSLLAKNLLTHVQRLILVTTPIDFHASRFNMATLVRKIDHNLLQEVSLIPGQWLTSFFISLNPIETIGKKYLRFLQNHKNKVWLQQFLCLEKWFLTAPPQASQLLQDFIDLFFQKNSLLRKKILANLHLPLLNVIAAQDKLISPDACLGFRAYQHPAYTEYLIPTGHLGLYLNSDIRNQTINFISRWLLSKSNLIK